VAFDPRQATLPGPATVAIHDDGNVSRSDFWRRHPQSMIVSARVGPTLMIVSFAPVNAEIRLR